MAQFLSQNLSQHMRLEQRLTPRLIQSMTVLQKPVADLEAYVQEALESNPALEAAEPEPGEEEKEETKRPDRNGVKDDRFARLDRFSRDYESDFVDRGPRRVGGDDGLDPKMGAMANAPDHSENLQEHLAAQWGLLEVADDVLAAGLAIIYKLDQDGYLRVPLEDVATAARPPVPVSAVQAALPLIQRLEPIGVAARDLPECLLLQLAALPGDNQIEKALIEGHLEEVAENRLPAIAKATHYSVGEIVEAIKVIRTTLHPHPGYLVGERVTPPVRPDVIVDYAEEGGGLDVRLARGNSPRLRIREDVAAMARSKDDGDATREFAKKHVEAAATLIDAIQFRRSRLLDVAKAVVEKQRTFFDEGSAGLRGLKMAELARELECDSSTISRTVADKYVQTPRGIFPLRYFFTGGAETEDGETVGWDHVKTRVKELVEAENPKNPVQDDYIAARLAAEGIDVSRRTIAKYRQRMGIPSARQRKQF